MLEREYQRYIIERIEELFQGCIVLKNDPQYIQGFPDLLILFNNNWAALEVKADPKAKLQANQKHYISLLDEMSYASFICPENQEVIFNELQQALSPGWPTRFSIS